MKKPNLIKYLFNVEHIWVLVFTFILGGVAYGLLHISAGFINPVKRAVENFSLSDLYFGVDWETDEQPEKSELITLIDATKLYDRGSIANLLNEVDSCKPKAVGVDMIFERRLCDSLSDEYLQEAAEKMKNAVFACKLAMYEKKDSLIQDKKEVVELKDSSFHAVVKSYFSEAIAPREGYANTVSNAYSTVLRHLSIERKLDGKPFKSFTAAVADLAVPGCLPPTPEEKYLIKYNHLDFPVVSCDSVLANRKLIEGRIALIGTLDAEQDMHFTPIGNIPGMKVQAYSIQTLLDGHRITTISCFWHCLLVIVFTYLTALWQLCWIRISHKGDMPLLFFLGESKLVMRLLTLLWMALIAWGGYFLYDHYGLYINFVWLLVFIVLVGEGRGIHTAFLKVRDKCKWLAKLMVKHSIYL